MAASRNRGLTPSDVRVVRPAPFETRERARRDTYGLVALIALGVGLAIALVVALNAGHDVKPIERGQAAALQDATTLAGAERLALGGQSMSEGQAATLEEQLDPGSVGLVARTRLLGYYSANLHEPQARQGVARHVRALIEQEPAAPVLATAYARAPWDDATYATLRAVLLKRLQIEPSVAVVRNAARLIGERELRTAEEILLRGQILDPDDAAWSQLRGMLEQEAGARAVGGPAGADEDEALERALTALDKAVERQPNGPVPFSLLADASARAYRRGEAAMARGYAEEGLRLAPSHRDHWARGEVAHIAHTVLGLLALEADDLGSALKNLKASADIPSSPRLSRRGPETALAKALLAKGREADVLAYLSATAHFWPAGRDSGAIARWRAAIRDGETPDFATP